MGCLCRSAISRLAGSSPDSMERRGLDFCGLSGPDFCGLRGPGTRDPLPGLMATGLGRSGERNSTTLLAPTALSLLGVGV